MSLSIPSIEDVIKEKPLSDLLLGIRELLKRHQHQLIVTVDEKNGKVSGIEITARIQT